MQVSFRQFRQQLFLLGLFIFFKTYALHAQPDPRIIDSLEQLLQTNLVDTARMNVLKWLVRELNHNDFEKSEKYYREYIYLATQIKDVKKQVNGKFALSNFYDRYSLIDSAEIQTKEGLDLIKTNNRTDLNDIEGKLLVNLGNFANWRNQYYKAVAYYEAGQKKIALERDRMVVLFNMSNVQSRLGNNEAEVLENYTKVKAFAAQNGMSRFEAAVTTSIGEVYFDLGENEKAINYHREALKLLGQGDGIELDKAPILLSIADIYFIQEPAKGLKEYKRILEDSRLRESKEEININLRKLTKAYWELGITDEALVYGNEYFNNTKNYPEGDTEKNSALYLLAGIYNRKKDFSRAYIYAKQAIKGYNLSEEKGGADYLRALKQLVQAAQFTGNSKEAWASLQLRDSLIEARNTETQKNALAAAEVKYRLQEKELAFQKAEQAKELELSRANNRQTLLLSLLGGAGLILFGGFFAYNRLQKANKTIEKQKELVETTLLEKDAVKTRFFANISHELRTPLTLLLGPIQTVLERNSLVQQDYDLLTIAKQSGRQLHQLINAILDFSRLDISTLTLKEKPTELYPLLSRIVAQFESNAQNQNIAIHFNFLTKEILNIQLDTEKFEIIVNNLLSNALKFTPKGGQIKVEIKEIGQQLELMVSDNGKGIHPDDLPHIFDRFYQTKVAKNKIDGGSGIGLALSREYADLFQGDLRVESKVGVGSTFYFSFPKKEVEALAEISATEVSPTALAAITEAPSLEVVPTITTAVAKNKGERPHLLVVEDNYDLQNYLQIILKDSYDVKIAENGQIALDMLQTTSFDLIVSDVMMPVMDGFQLLEKLKKQDQFRQIPIIMLTALAGQKDKLKALRIGVDDYLTKPFDKEELTIRIDNLLNNYHNRKLAHTESLPEDEAIEPLVLKSDWLANLERLMETQLTDTTFSIEALPAQLAMSRRQFFRTMKTETGLTPHQYLKEVRLQKGRELLETKEKLTVKEISYAVGFQRTSYFSQLFKQRFGKIPSEYRLNYWR